MTDEQFVFVQDVKEKKVTAHSACHRVGKRKKVTFPSDHMTKKELAKMSGEVKEYNIKNPMKWAEFKKMPDDLRKEYLTRLRKLYSATNPALAKMFGVSEPTVRLECHKLGVPAGEKHGRTAPEWYSFIKYGTPDPAEKVEEVKCDPVECVPEEVVKPCEEPKIMVKLPELEKIEPKIEKAELELDYLRNRVRQLEYNNAILEAKMSVVNMIFGNRTV